MSFWTWIAIAIALIGGIFAAISGANKKQKNTNDTVDQD